jgi:hypothetical protein
MLIYIDAVYMLQAALPCIMDPDVTFFTGILSRRNLFLDWSLQLSTYYLRYFLSAFVSKSLYECQFRK